MTQFIIVPIFFLVALGVMWLTLYIGKYKQGGESCCSGGHCSSTGEKDPNHNCSHERELDENVPKFEKIEIVNLSK